MTQATAPATNAPATSAQAPVAPAEQAITQDQKASKSKALDEAVLAAKEAQREADKKVAQKAEKVAAAKRVIDEKKIKDAKNPGITAAETAALADAEGELAASNKSLLAANETLKVAQKAQEDFNRDEKKISDAKNKAAAQKLADLKQKVKMAEDRLKKYPDSVSAKADLATATAELTAEQAAQGESASGGIGGFFSGLGDKLKGANLFSGGLFALIGFLVAGIFGDGLVGSIAKIMLPVGMFFMGSQNGMMGDFFSSLVGGGRSKTAAAGASPTPARGVAAPLPVLSTEAAKPYTVLSDAGMQALLDQAHKNNVQTATVTIRADAADKNKVIPQMQQLADAEKHPGAQVAVATLKQHIADCSAQGNQAAVAFAPKVNGQDFGMACVRSTSVAIAR